MSAWATLPLGQVVTFQRGYDLPYRARKRGEIPIVSSAGVTDFHDIAMIDPPGVVTGRYGTIGEIFLISEPFWPLNTTLYVRDFHGNDPRFIYYLLQRFDFASFSGKSGVPGVNRNDLHVEAVTLPTDVAEQRAIATALSDVDTLLEGLNRLIAKKRKIRAAIMQQLLTGKTHLPSFSGAWDMKTLEQVADCLDHVRIPLNEAQRENMPGPYPYCGANGVLDYVNDFVIDDDVILIAEDGGYFDEYAHRPIAYRMSGKIWVNNHAHILKAKRGNSDAFLYFALVHKNILAYLASGTRAKLNKSEMNKIEIYLPLDSAEQEAIAAVLSDNDAEMGALEARRNKTRDLRRAVMQKLLTGKTRLVMPDATHA